jgi:hypothetical protein
MSTLAPTGSRQSTFRVSLSVDGVDYGVWEKKTGGKTSGNTQVLKPGGMGPQQSLGGTPTTDTLTLTRNFDRVRDQPMLGQLRAGVGRSLCVAKVQPLDADGNAYGNADVYNGTLDAVAPPDVDSSSDSSAEISIDIVVTGNPAA